MKQCLQCNKVYEDGTLNYCLEDGSTLVSFADGATQETIIRQTNQETAILPRDEDNKSLLDQQGSAQGDPAPAAPERGVNRVFAYLTVGLLGFLVLIAGVALLVWINSNPANSNDQAAKQIPNVQNSTNKLEPKTNAENVKVPKPIENPVNKPPETPPPSEGTWFIILGSYPQSQSANADQRLQFIQSKGFEAKIINTDGYPGLRKGLNAVVMGPYTKSIAQSTLRNIKSTISDAYIKSGS